MNSLFWSAELNPATPALDIHGQRPYDALIEVAHFIDQALLHNHAVVKIIHGHGSGVLKKALADWLKTEPHIAGFQDSNLTHESGAVTYIALK